MNEKQFYTSPEVDVLVVRFEANIMSPNGGTNPFDEDSEEEW